MLGFASFFLCCSSVSFAFSFWTEYLTEAREYAAVYSSWAGSEEELRRPLEGVAGCVTTCCGALEELSENMNQDFLPVLREYILYVESIQVRGRAPCSGRHVVHERRRKRSVLWDFTRLHLKLMQSFKKDAQKKRTRGVCRRLCEFYETQKCFIKWCKEINHETGKRQ